MTHEEIIEELKRLPKEEVERVASYLRDQGIEPALKPELSSQEVRELEKRTKDADDGRHMVGPFASAKELIANLEGQPRT